jgi:hypothetical protein
MRLRLVEVALILLAAGTTQGVGGQEAVPPLPPRIDEAKPGEVTLARLPEKNHQGIEEIIVVAEDRFQLPDLGSSWHPPQKAPGRFQTTVLPLYDPQSPERWPDLFAYTPENQRITYVELFRVRFGRRN